MQGFRGLNTPRPAPGRTLFEPTGHWVGLCLVETLCSREGAKAGFFKELVKF
jgi:hypothetical protein